MKALAYILLVAGIICLLSFVISASGLITYPFGLDFGEGYLLYHAIKISSGQNIYEDINSYPYTVCNYPPLYPLIAGILTDKADVSLTPGRMVTVVSTVACVWLIGFIVLRLTRDQLISVVSGLMFLALPAVFRWGHLMRVDSLAVAFALGGIAVYVGAGDKRKPWCIIFFVLAFLTKQSMLAAPIAVFAHWISTDRKSGIRFLLIAIAFGFTAFILCDLISGWGLHRHIFGYTANEWFLLRMKAGFSIFIADAAPVLIAAVICLFISKSLTTESPLPLYFILATGTMITYGFEGSDTNYFIEPFASAVLLTGVGIHSLRSMTTNNKKSPWPVMLILVLLLAQILMVRVIRSEDFRVMYVGQADAGQGAMLVSLMENTEGDVLSEDASFQLVAGKDVLFAPYIMTLLAEKGKWDQSGFVEDLRQGKFDLIVLRFNVHDPDHKDRSDNFDYRLAGLNRFSDEMEAAIIEAYEIDPVLGFHSRRPWYIYWPRQ